jgi:uncharacterized protein YoxC
VIRLRDATITQSNLLANVRQIIKWCNQIENQYNPGEVKHELEDIIRRLQALEVQISNLIIQLNSINNRIDVIYDFINTIMSDINEIKTALHDLITRVSNVEQSVIELQTAITDLQSQLATLLAILDTDVQTDTEIQSSESTVNIAIEYTNLKTGQTNTVVYPLPVASTVEAGVINAEDYKALLKAIADIAGLQGAGYVFANLGQEPTQAALTNAWQAAKGSAPIEGSHIINLDESNTQYMFANKDGVGIWLSQGNFALPIATQTVLGGIYSSLADGTGYVNGNGVLSVNGWDVLSGRVTTLESTVAGLQTALNAHIGNKNNPHEVTKAQVGLGNVDNIQQATKTEFNTHNNDNTRHITAGERTAWNAKQNALNGASTDVVRGNAAMASLITRQVSGTITVGVNDTILAITAHATLGNGAYDGQQLAIFNKSTGDATLTVSRHSRGFEGDTPAERKFFLYCGFIHLVYDSAFTCWKDIIVNNARFAEYAGQADAASYATNAGSVSQSGVTGKSNIRANLGSTTAQNALITDIGVTGILPIANGGTGATNLVWQNPGIPSYGTNFKNNVTHFRVNPVLRLAILSIAVIQNASTTVASGGTILTLLPGYRPAAGYVFSAITDANSASYINQVFFSNENDAVRITHALPSTGEKLLRSQLIWNY